jgi:hypothetical protein
MMASSSIYDSMDGEDVAHLQGKIVDVMYICAHVPKPKPNAFYRFDPPLECTDSYLLA